MKLATNITLHCFLLIIRFLINLETLRRNAPECVKKRKKNIKLGEGRETLLLAVSAAAVVPAFQNVDNPMRLLHRFDFSCALLIARLKPN